MLPWISQNAVSPHRVGTSIAPRPYRFQGLGGTLYQGPKFVKRLLFVIDILLTAIALFVADYLRRHAAIGVPIEPTTTFLNPLLYILAALIWAFVLHTFSIYDFRRLSTLRDELKELSFAIPTAVFIFAGFLYFSFRDVPRLLILYFLVLDILSLFAVRLPRELLLRHYVLREDYVKRPLVTRRRQWLKTQALKEAQCFAEWVASKPHLRRSLVATDLLLTLCTFFLADYARSHIAVGMPVEPTATFLNPFVYILVALIWAFVLHTFSMYDSRKLTSLPVELKELSFAIPTAVFILAGFLYFSFRDVPRLLLLYFLALNLVWLTVARFPREPLFRYLKRREREPREAPTVTLEELEELSSRARVPILGVPVCPCTADEAIRYVIQSVHNCHGVKSSLHGDQCTMNRELTISYANAHTLNVAYQDVQYREILKSADLVYCDGGGVVLGARLLGEYLPARMTGADWIYPLARICAEESVSLYLLGSKTGVAEMAATRLQALYPGLPIAGTHEGYVASSVDRSLRVIADVNRAAPDILLVGMGAPLQEKWLAIYRERIQVPVCWAVGALFDFVAGVVPRAPRWMLDHSMEWLFRLMMEPQRLGQRYLWGNPLFVYRVLRQRAIGDRDGGERDRAHAATRPTVRSSERGQ
jgi:N-acetylglucosaminyldiphosphoundecaprenol N-acetyl-beta-D-mannosaminyltransferase